MMNNPEQTYEEPREYTPNNVIYWEETSKQLRHNPKTKFSVLKANRFLRGGCIERKSETEWVCKPLKDYNKLTHVIRSTINSTCDELVCSCQGFAKKEYDYKHKSSGIKPFCSHTIAVQQFCFLEAQND